MEYRVRRTSEWNSDVPPCEGAFKKSVVRVDMRNTDDPKKIPVNKGNDGDWYTRGTNHRVENGCICRDMGFYDEWRIEIADILQFVKMHGTCVVEIHFDGTPSVEIYDDYRE